MGVCNCSMFCCTLLYVHSSIAIILMGKRELIGLLNLSSWCLVMVERLFLAVPRGSLQFVIVVFPDHTHYFLPCTQGQLLMDAKLFSETTKYLKFLLSLKINLFGLHKTAWCQWQPTGHCNLVICKQTQDRHLHAAILSWNFSFFH